VAFFKVKYVNRRDKGGVRKSSKRNRKKKEIEKGRGRKEGKETKEK
jgi:hypothetical protein